MGIAHLNTKVFRKHAHICTTETTLKNQKNPSKMDPIASFAVAGYVLKTNSYGKPIKFKRKAKTLSESSTASNDSAVSNTSTSSTSSKSSMEFYSASYSLSICKCLSSDFFQVR